MATLNPNASGGSSLPPVDPVALKQASQLFDAIATTAAEIDEAFFHLDPEAGQARDHMLRLIRGLAAQIGWMADLGCDKIGGIKMRGGAEEWLMSPVYNQLAENASKGVVQ